MGMTVEMLPKEQEGHAGALGTASSFSGVSCLAMDLGGGSMQITWMIVCEGKLETSLKGSYRFPYGQGGVDEKAGRVESREIQGRRKGGYGPVPRWLSRAQDPRGAC
jgi:exopolyphosphatase/pppGpp-phosphohydrolase